METLDAIRRMLRDADLSPYEAAVRTGRSRTYVSNLLTRGSLPSSSRLATIVNACGYRLAIVPATADLPDGSIVIDPEGRQGDSIS